MHKQTIILVVILALVTGVLIFLAVTNQNILKNNGRQAIPSVAPVVKTAKVFFNPATIDLSTSQAVSTSVDIMVDSGGTSIAGVQAEMQYDPKAITNVKITPDTEPVSFFGADSTILFNDINPTTGRISYVIAISPTQNGKKGTGKIGTLSFQKAIGAPASTTVNFLDKTLVTELNVNQSVLKQAVPLTITLSKTTQIPAQTTPVATSPAFVPVSPAQ